MQYYLLIFFFDLWRAFRQIYHFPREVHFLHFHFHPKLLATYLQLALQHLKDNRNINPLTPFYTPWKHHKTRCFMIFSGDIEMERCLKGVNEISKFISKLWQTTLSVFTSEKTKKPNFEKLCQIIRKTLTLNFLFLKVQIRKNSMTGVSNFDYCFCKIKKIMF